MYNLGTKEPGYLWLRKKKPPPGGNHLFSAPKQNHSLKFKDDRKV